MSYYKIILLLMFSSLYISAQSYLGLNVNDKDLELSGKFNLNIMSQNASGTQYFVTANYLHTDTDNMFIIGISGEGSLPDDENIVLSLGLQSVFSDEFTAFPFVLKASYHVPLEGYRIPPISLSAEYAYAPPVLSLREANTYASFRAEASIEAITNVHLYLGYRNIKTNYKTYDQTFNGSIYVGGKLTF